MPFLSRIIFIPLLRSGKTVFRGSDHGWLEYLGGQGFISKTRSLFSMVIDMGIITNIKFYMYICFVVLVFIFLLI